MTTTNSHAASSKRPGPSMLLFVTTLLAALAFPVALAAGNAVELSLKSGNPDGVDITQGLAYLQPILLTTFAILAGMALVVIVGVVVLWRREGLRSALLPAIVFFASVVVGVIGAQLDGAIAEVVRLAL